MQSGSVDSDVTFAAAFGHTQDESPNGDAPPELAVIGSASAHPETLVASQVESMVTNSHESPLPGRKVAETLVKRNSMSAWGDEDEQTEIQAVAAFEVDFENDPFGDNVGSTKRNTWLYSSLKVAYTRLLFCSWSAIGDRRRVAVDLEVQGQCPGKNQLESRGFGR